jgi:hypothetical protein
VRGKRKRMEPWWKGQERRHAWSRARSIAATPGPRTETGRIGGVREGSCSRADAGGGTCCVTPGIAGTDEGGAVHVPHIHAAKPSACAVDNTHLQRKSKWREERRLGAHTLRWLRRLMDVSQRHLIPKLAREINVHGSGFHTRTCSRMFSLRDMSHEYDPTPSTTRRTSTPRAAVHAVTRAFGR